MPSKSKTKKAPEVPTREDLAAFQALLGRLQIRDVQLLESTVVSDRAFVAARGVIDGGVEVSLDVTGTGAASLDSGTVTCELTLSWEGTQPKTDRTLVRVEEVYLLSYNLTGSEPINEATLRAFTQHNAAFNVWPFFRASLHSTILRMGLPPYTLPLMKPQTDG